MKIILTAKRNPSMTRPQFFAHLRHEHWPLVRRFPEVLAQIRRYEQNHSFLPEEDGDVTTPWRRAVERDSVIEVWFKDFDGLHRMDAAPNYANFVSPDEAVFNDLKDNVLLTAREELFHHTSVCGRIKRFDFLYRNVDHARFESACGEAARSLALDPLFQALADRQTIHFPVREDGSMPAETDTAAVVATWTSSLDAMARLSGTRFAEGFAQVADPDRSFSVLATTFPIHRAAEA